MEHSSPDMVAVRVNELLKEREEHQDAIDRIDMILNNVQAALGSGRGGARGTRAANGRAGARGPGARGGRGRRKRGSFETTGEESVLGFIKAHGKPTGRDIEQHWKSEGRGGFAANTLSRLVKERRLKREPVKDGRGSRYVIA